MVSLNSCLTTPKKPSTGLSSDVYMPFCNTLISLIRVLPKCGFWNSASLFCKVNSRRCCHVYSLRIELWGWEVVLVSGRTEGWSTWYLWHHKVAFCWNSFSVWKQQIGQKCQGSYEYVHIRIIVLKPWVGNLSTAPPMLDFSSHQDFKPYGFKILVTEINIEHFPPWTW